MATNTNKHEEIFDYRTLRLMVGIVALALPFVTWVIAMFSGVRIDSISASYWVDGARDFFVGGLFIIATLMTAYNGHEPGHIDGQPLNTTGLKMLLSEKWLSKTAALGAVGVALFPTTNPKCCDLGPCSDGSGQCIAVMKELVKQCTRCTADYLTILHYISAVVVFAVITYFCFVPFYRGALKKADEADAASKSGTDTYKAKQKEIADKARLRAHIYWWSGVVMVGSLALAMTSFFESIGRYFDWWNLFLGETGALIAFGVSWFTASKVASPLVHEEERLQIK